MYSEIPKWRPKERKRLLETLSGNACDSVSPRDPFLVVLTALLKGWGRFPSGRELNFQENPKVDPECPFPSILVPRETSEGSLYVNNWDLNSNVFCCSVLFKNLCKMTPQKHLPNHAKSSLGRLWAPSGLRGGPKWARGGSGALLFSDFGIICYVIWKVLL